MDNEMMKAILGTDFETFLSDLMEERSEAESMLDMMKQNDLDALALKSVNFLSCSHDDMYSLEKCAYLLSRLLNVDDDLCTWRNLSTSTQSAIKSFLLNPIINFEESQFISKVRCYTIYRLAASLLPDNNWPELLPFLYQCLTDSNNCFKASAFLIFADLAGDIGETIVVPSAKTLHSLFRNTLNDDTVDLNVRIVAMRAVIRFIQHMSSSNEKERFQDLLPGMMKTLTDAYLSKGEEDQVADEQPLTLFIELAKNEPRFLRRQLVDVVATMFDIAEDEGLKEETTHLAVEFLITLVEAKKRAPGMIKRVPFFISRCFAMLLKLLLYIEDDPAWHSALDASDDTGATSYYCKGKKCLDRFSLALGGKSIAHVAIEQLSAYSAAPEWEKHHAALIALGQIAEGCSKVMIKNLEQVVAMVLNCFQDPHPRVKCAACYAICRLLVDFFPHLQEKCHNQVLPALAAAMDDFHPRVQAHAAAALCHFGVPGKPETLIHHLDGLVNKLLVHLKNGKQIVQQEALKALSFIAGSVEEHFRTCYEAVMPHLKTLLRNADLQSNLIVLSCAMECISCVVMAVGKEKFRDDEKQVMEMLMSLQAKVDDPTTTKYLLHACCRICECMGKDFLPYMNVVMPFLLQCAQLNTISMEQYNENYKVDANSKETLEMKAKACRLLCWYAETLKEDFYPWISQAVSILVPLQKFYTHRLVRESAVKGLHFLLRSAKLAVEKGVAQDESESYFTKLSDHIILALVEALHKEFETEMCVVMLRELNGCLQICVPLLNEAQVRSIVDEIKYVITNSSKRERKQELKERAKMEDFDAEEAELLREESEQEEKVFENARYILRTLIRTFKASFLPFLDELSSYLLPMWAKEKTTTERCSSICIFDNLMEECPEAALKYYDSCLPLILDASNDEDPDVRQAALYGLGLWAEYGRSSFKPFVGEALSRINVVIMHLRAREHENESAYDNAVSALGKICQFHGESFDSAEAIPAWLNCLPIKADLEEAKDVHTQLCSMIERSYGELLGPNYQYLPKVVSVFIEVLCAGEVLATEDTAKRMINLLRHFQHTLPPATWASAQSLLLPEQEMELESIVSPEEDVNISIDAMKLLVL
ncbi:uncharacterized protein LOC132030992 isoform X4 [Lycium ferocissimum]|uniref:uncharacterized protein LOC132030992 isoform X4 n=1 Tax=Lycium ferocissimum TaxID=112874 RepID=UPI002816296C|nr:uncharacterized protein LOC132030992 isoform X4 [Lycium ferocissimum]